MRRPRSDIKGLKLNDIRKDFTPEQLEGIGALALAYNEVEVLIDILVNTLLELRPALVPWLTSRINGIDGKIELIKIAISDAGVSPEINKLFTESLGENGLRLLKGYRDAVIHARVQNVAVAIGTSPAKRGKAWDVLLTTTAFNGSYDRLVALRKELQDAALIASYLVTLRRATETNVAIGVKTLPSGSIKRIEVEIQAVKFRYQSHQIHRLSLPPLPEFPSESELHEAGARWMREYLAEAAKEAAASD